MGRTKGAADLYFNNSRDDLSSVDFLALSIWDLSLASRFAMSVRLVSPSGRKPLAFRRSL
jgi:hypothetical protein